MKNNRVPKTFRLSQEAVEILDAQENATQFVEELILTRTQLISKGESLIIDMLQSMNELPKLKEVVEDEAFIPLPPDPIKGYLCCEKQMPCKHWQWDGLKEAHVNSLTGEIREVNA